MTSHEVRIRHDFQTAAILEPLIFSKNPDNHQNGQNVIKDDASFCYCAYVLRIGLFGFLKEFAHKNNNNFARFVTMWKKQILARAIRTQKENWG